MRRSPLLVVQVLCPHFARPVQARRNEVTERLVDCDEKSLCATQQTSPSGLTLTVYPRTCPVFRAEERS